MDYLDDQIRQRKEKDNELFEDSFIQLASAVVGKSSASRLSDDRIVTKEAVDEILKFFHYKPGEIPDNVTDDEDILEVLFRPFGIMRREITLEEGWHRQTCGPILAFLKEGERPVALLPKGLSGYVYKDRLTGEVIRVTKKNEKDLMEKALCFYRPMPMKSMKVRDLFSYMRECFELRDLFFVFLATAAVTVFGMLITQITKAMAGPVCTIGDVGLLAGLVFFVVCVIVASTLISSFGLLLTDRIGKKTGLYMEAALMMRILSLPSVFFRKYSTGDLAKRTQLIKPMCNLLIGTGFSAFLSAILSLMFIGQFAGFAQKLVAPAFSIIMAVVVTTFITVIFQIRQTKRVLEYSTKESVMSLSLISGIQKIKLAGAEKRAFSKWAAAFAAYAGYLYNPPLILKLNTDGTAAVNDKKQVNERRPSNAVPTTFVNMAIVLFGTIGLYLTAAGNHVSAGDYFAFNTGFALLLTAFLSLSTAAVQMAQVIPMLSLISPVLEAEPETSEKKKVITKLSGGIELDNVSFRYDENSPLVIDNLSIKIRPGEYVAIVGTTGCGKSTLMRLLLGFEHPTGGAVYYDGKDVSSVDLKSLRSKVGTVMQDTGLFQGDIYSNIVISDPQLTMEDAWEAAEIAGIADDIRDMPMGMYTQLSEGQGGISGGQKQRLLIARAIAAKPKILMFDEATSALDNITQKEVTESLEKLDCTRIVIAHRLSTIKNCGRILVLDKGRIVEEGNYDELMKMNGLFASLARRQQV